VLRASRDFQPEAVVRLYEGVREHWVGPLDFLCLTDTAINHPGVREAELRNPLPGYWSKLNLFDPAIPGDLLYFDLDVMPVGSLADFQNVRWLTMLRALVPRRCSGVNSSIMALPAEARRPIWDELQHRDPAAITREYAWGGRRPYAWGDQGFLEETWKRHHWPIGLWQVACPGQVESFKHTVKKRGAVGENTRVVYFHGKPRPWDIGWQLPGRSVA
jgi:hypothetical protein